MSEWTKCRRCGVKLIHKKTIERKLCKNCSKPPVNAYKTRVKNYCWWVVRHLNNKDEFEQVFEQMWNQFEGETADE